jgi:TetR/AcrR family transcriptional repressor of nem operon
VRHSMRYPEGHKDEVRASIVEAASRALRRDGLAGVSVPALMKAAGLTHGGFYGHFKNRDELVAAAVLAGAADTANRVLKAEKGGLEAVLEAYLSRVHVGDPGGGCVLAALGGEARSQRAPVRRAFAEAARGFLHLLQRKVRPTGDSRRLEDDTLALASRMVGAIVLARLVEDERLADRILTAARQG